MHLYNISKRGVLEAIKNSNLLRSIHHILSNIEKK